MSGDGSTSLSNHLTPLDLLASAQAQGADPNQLAKYMDLYERWEDREGEKKYNEAMNSAQGEIQQIITSKENKHTKSRYAALEDIDGIVRPIYVKHGFSLTFSNADSPITNHYRLVCEVRHKAGYKTYHFMDGQSDDKGAKGGDSKTPIQGIMSSNTYMRRGLYSMVFNLAFTGEDNDGNSTDYITSDQVGTINDHLVKTNTNLDGFLNWVKAESLDKMLASKFDVAIAWFKQREANQKKGSPK